MSQYVLIESKSPLEGGDHSFELGRQLRDGGHAVSIYLVEDGVLAARRRFTAGAKLVTTARRHGIPLLADEVSLRQRGITTARLSEAVRIGTVDELLDLLMEQSDRAIWH